MTEKTFPIELKDGTYHLRFDNHALYRFEEVQGESAVMVMMKGATGVRPLNHFIWAGLLHEYPHITVSEVINNVDSHKLKEYGMIISKAIDYALSTGKEDKADTKKKPK